MSLGNFGNMPIMLFTTISHKFSLDYNYWETLVMCNFMAYADKCIDSKALQLFLAPH